MKSKVMLGIVAVLLLASLPGPASAGEVQLHNAWADFEQVYGTQGDGPYTAASAIDEYFTPSSPGWAIYPEVGVDHFATFQTVVPIAFPDQTDLTFTMQQYHASMFPISPRRLLGRFRISVTSDLAPFDAGTMWTTLTPTKFTSADGMTGDILGDGSIFIDPGQPIPTGDTYTVAATTSGLITGFRLEVLADSRLPQHGPGLADDGNFALTQFTVDAVPEPATLSLLALGGLAVLRRRRR